MGYLWGFWFVLTSLTILVLKFFDPEKSRPSIDDGASAPEHMTMQQRALNAVSLKNMAQRMSLSDSFLMLMLLAACFAILLRDCPACPARLSPAWPCPARGALFAIACSCLH